LSSSISPFLPVFGNSSSWDPLGLRDFEELVNFSVIFTEEEIIHSVVFPADDSAGYTTFS